MSTVRQLEIRYFPAGQHLVAWGIYDAEGRRYSRGNAPSLAEAEADARAVLAAMPKTPALDTMPPDDVPQVYTVSTSAEGEAE